MRSKCFNLVKNDAVRSGEVRITRENFWNNVSSLGLLQDETQSIGEVIINKLINVTNKKNINIANYKEFTKSPKSLWLVFSSKNIYFALLKLI